MVSTPELLKLPPTDALEILIQSSLKAGFNVKYLTFGPPVAVDGVRTEISLTLNKGKAPVEYWGLEGDVLYYYNRLDLADFFTGLDTTFIVDFPLTVEDLLDLLEERFGVLFGPGEFITGQITNDNGGRFTLKASPTSPRWVGSVEFTFTQRIKPLTEVLPVTLLDTMAYTLLDETKPALERIVESLNRLNARTLNRPLRIDELHVGHPVQIGQTNDLDNTQLELTMLTDDTYTGSIVIRYQRRFMPRMSGYNPIVLHAPTAGRYHEVARLAADRVGFYLDLADVEDGPLPAVTIGEVRTLTLPILNHSLMYFGDMTVDFSR